LSESNGIELQAGRFWSQLNPAARRVFDETGFVPDAQRPTGGLWGAWRRSLGYGKLAMGGGGLIVHFDLQGFARAGALFTDRGATPALSVGPAVLVRVGAHVWLQLDVGALGSLERRSRATAFIPAALSSLSLGVAL
jgi:hypothetical protein